MKKILNPYEEYVGILQNLLESDESIIAMFADGNQVILPQDRHIANLLKSLEGRKIGILKTDNIENQYIVIEQ